MTKAPHEPCVRNATLELSYRRRYIFLKRVDFYRPGLLIGAELDTVIRFTRADPARATNTTFLKELKYA